MIPKAQLQLALLTLAPLALVSTSAGQCQLQLVQQVPDPQFGAHKFGESLAIDGPLFAIGHPDDYSPADAADGTVAVYSYDGVQWLPAAKLQPNAPSGFAEFGSSVAVQGSTILVGEPKNSDVGHETGAVYFFTKQPQGWFQSFQFHPPTYPVDARFGASVCLDGDTALVGAPGDPLAGSGAGAVYVYRKVGLGWSLSAELRASDAAAGKGFGASLALDGSDALVSDGKDGVYAFARSSGIWTQIQKLAPNDPGPPDKGFGAALALEGSLAVVGAPFDNVGNGAAYVFEKQGGLWVEKKKLQASDSQSGWALGRSAAIQAGHLFIGAPGSGTAGQGSTYVFKEIGGTWMESSAAFSPNAGVAGAGTRVAVSGDTLLMGATYTDPMGGPGAYRGAVSVQSISNACCILTTNTDAVYHLLGGSQFMSLSSAEQQAGKVYLVLGTTAGISPGLPIGSILLPLNHDGPGGYLLYTLGQPNSAFLDNTLGLLNAEGRAYARFNLPPNLPPGAVGITLHHAFLLFDIPGTGAAICSSPAARLFIF